MLSSENYLYLQVHINEAVVQQFKESYNKHNDCILFMEHLFIDTKIIQSNIEQIENDDDEILNYIYEIDGRKIQLQCDKGCCEGCWIDAYTDFDTWFHIFLNSAIFLIQ